jgi:cytochrome c peroxidase
MKNGKIYVFVVMLVFGVMGGISAAQALTPLEGLGKNIFFDQNLSLNGNQSCAACHAPESGWTGPDPSIINRLIIVLT